MSEIEEIKERLRDLAARVTQHQSAITRLRKRVSDLEEAKLKEIKKAQK